MARKLNLLINTNIDETVPVEVNNPRNQRGQAMIAKCLEALGKGKHDFGNDWDRYELSLYDEFLRLIVWLETGKDLYIDIPWPTLFSEEMIREFSAKGYTIPDDITKEQEYEAEKVIIEKIGDEYKRNR